MIAACGPVKSATIDTAFGSNGNGRTEFGVERYRLAAIGAREDDRLGGIPLADDIAEHGAVERRQHVGTAQSPLAEHG